MAILWRFPLQPQLFTAGSPVTGTTALTSGLIGTTPPQIPAGIYGAGAHLMLRAHIEVTTSSSTPTLTAGFYFGAPSQAIGSETLLGASPALVLSASATAWAVTMVYNATIRSLDTGVSSNGVIHGSGEVFSFVNTGLSAAGAVFPLGATAAGRTVSTFSTNVNQQVDVGLTFSSSAGSASATVTDFWAELTG